jgi:DDE superfamily endonuclease
MADLLQEACEKTFAQKRSCTRAMELSLGTLCALGRRTISRSICAVGRQYQDWSADYKIFSRSSWEPNQLFAPVVNEYLLRYPEGPVCVAFDDTKFPKSGRKITSAFWQRDPLSPPFHVNFLYGLRFMHASLIFPHYRESECSARAYPIRFVECPAVKKPGKKATEAARQEYKKAVKTRNLSEQGRAIINDLRTDLDRLGGQARTILVAVDGSLCNRTLMALPLERVDIVGRCRKDARLCFPAPKGRRIYGKERFSPESVRQDDTVPRQICRIHYGGAWRDIRYKEANRVLWQRGAGPRTLRLSVIAPLPYKTSVNARRNYRDPAYLLCTDLSSEVNTLLQCYFDRWQIEVNHREQKDTLGVGNAQVWSRKSVPRQPAFAVASYSLLLLAGLKEFGPGRTHDYVALPAWRKNATRPSALDLITLLRKEMNEAPIGNILKRTIAKNIMSHAYT